MLFQTGDRDGADIVLSVRDGYSYMCPDVASVDRYIRRLIADYLSERSNASEVVKQFARKDIDHLLERRSYLVMVAA